VTEPLPWANKIDDRLLYRGQISGIYHVDHFPWRQGQRDRLAFFVDDQSTKEADVLVQSGDDVKVAKKWFPHQSLVERYLDIGMVNEVSLMSSSPYPVLP
jgi:hypothetical protein